MTKEIYETLVWEYVTSKALSWSNSTSSSELSRLLQMDPDKVLGKPAKFYEYLRNERGLKPYSIKTAFIRAGDFVEWLMDEGKIERAANAIALFMKSHANLFKNAYTRKPSSLSLKEIKQRISQIEDEASRAKAMQLLQSGMRWTESGTLDKQGMIVGKGGKARKAHVEESAKPVDYKLHKVTFSRHLSKVGLTPHVLRKAFATALVEHGASEADLMTIMGWSSILTASSYVGAKRERDLVQALHKELRENDKEQSPKKVPAPKRRGPKPVQSKGQRPGNRATPKRRA